MLSRFINLQRRVDLDQLSLGLQMLAVFVAYWLAIVHILMPFSLGWFPKWCLGLLGLSDVVRVISYLLRWIGIVFTFLLEIITIAVVDIVRNLPIEWAFWTPGCTWLLSVFIARLTESVGALVSIFWNVPLREIYCRVIETALFRVVFLATAIFLTMAWLGEQRILW